MPPIVTEKPPAKITWATMRAPEFWFFLVSAIAGHIALKTTPWTVHDVAIAVGAIVAATASWLTQKAREAPSPMQESVSEGKDRMLESKDRMLDSLHQVVNTLADCVQKNHPNPVEPTPDEVKSAQLAAGIRPAQSSPK